MKKSTLSARLREITLGIAYTLFVLLFWAVINYVTWTDSGEMTGTAVCLLALTIVLLYLPLIFLTQRANWQIREFGFVINGWVILLAVLLIAVSVFTTLSRPGTDLPASLIEAVARTGEELFFRGFVYAMVVRVLVDQKERTTQIWAVLCSSIAFAAIHTQTFLPEHNDTLFTVFLFALFLGILRAWTGSILPGIIIHLLFNTQEMSAVILAVPSTDCSFIGLIENVKIVPLQQNQDKIAGQRTQSAPYLIPFTRDEF